LKLQLQSHNALAVRKWDNCTTLLVFVYHQYVLK